MNEQNDSHCQEKKLLESNTLDRENNSRTDDTESDDQEFELISHQEDQIEVTQPRNLERGRKLISTYANTAPEGAGVYRMLSQDGSVLYVGKAKNLKKRISQYAKGPGHSARIPRMIAETFSMEIITTPSESAALLLEASLIRQLKPRYNVLLRDDKSFPFILLTNHNSPQLTRHRGARRDKGRYFGPFANTSAVNSTLEVLQKAFLIRTCEDSVFTSRTRPCLLHQIKRCAAPCTGEIKHEDYKTLVDQAADFLRGKSQDIRKTLAADMEAAAQKLDFEKAAALRDRITALASIQAYQGINPVGLEDADVFGLVEEAGQPAISIFFFRNGQNWGNRTYFPRTPQGTDLDEVMDSFLAQFYADKPAPKTILLSRATHGLTLIEQSLSEKMGHTVELIAPQRGVKREQVLHVERNAREALAQKLAQAHSQKKLLKALETTLKLETPLKRIEIYDNSHISGTKAVGACVVAGEEGFMKAHYRTYNMDKEDLKAGDDLGMMKAMLKRRLSKINTEITQTDPTAFPTTPSLIIIDGGETQFKTAKETLHEVGCPHIPLIAIAKGIDRDAGREVILQDGRPPYRLEPRDPVLYFLQRLRDEAHRFAIGTHRKKRQRDIDVSTLDQIAGIGPKRKRALLRTFGSIKAIREASLEDLCKVEGVNRALAQMILDSLS